MPYYVPGTLETDTKKIIYSLQQIGPGLDAADSAIATLQGQVGGWNNTRQTATATYTVQLADNQKTLALGGSAFFPVTFDNPSTYDAEHVNFVSNEDTGRGKQIKLKNTSGVVVDQFILWPLQKCIVFNQNNVWNVFPRHQPWMPDSQPTFNVDPSGSNSNDGLGTGSSGAFQTLNAAATAAYSEVYTRNVGSVLIDGGSNTYQEFVAVFYPLNGGGTLLFKNLVWKPITSGYCLQFGDNALVGLQDTELSSAGVTTPAGFVIGHQAGVLDVNANVSVTPTVSISGSVFDTDGETRFNINNGLTINAGTIGGFIYKSNQGTRWNVNGTHTFVGNPTIGRFAWVTLDSTLVLQGNVSFSGANTTSASLVNQGGIFQNLSGVAPPGGAPVPTTGGQYVTSTTA